MNKYLINWITLLIALHLFLFLMLLARPMPHHSKPSYDWDKFFYTLDCSRRTGRTSDSECI
jgi:hypothetical protein